MQQLDVAIVADEGDPHATAVMEWLARNEATAVRFNLGDLLLVRQQATSGRLLLEVEGSGDWILSEHTTVWWHRVGYPPTSTFNDEEAQLALDEAGHLLYGGLCAAAVRWVDEPSAIRRAELKQYQLATASRLELSVPATLVTNDSVAARSFAHDRRVVAKAVSPGIGIAPSVGEVHMDDLDLVAALPTMLQELIEAEADLRVVVVANQAWVWRRPRAPDEIDWREPDPHGGGFGLVNNPAVERAAIAMTSALGLTMSVQDWLEVDQNSIFLEVNPQGAWLFLRGSNECVVPRLAGHLLRAPSREDADGKWPKAIVRFGADFYPASKAPENDGIEAPHFEAPDWIASIAGLPEALEVARAARESAENSSKVAEAKANRLLQVVLGLLTITLALASYQLGFALDRPVIWLLTLVPVTTALFCLLLAAFESLQVDRVGMYLYPTLDTIRESHNEDSVYGALLRAEYVGRRLASWTASNKHSDLMQARAWFTRGLAAVITAGIVAALTRSR